MQKRINKIVMAVALVAMTGCSSGFRDTFGMRRNAPDEFKVVSNAPLALPPEFTLRPPTPGAKRPQELDLDKQAKDVLLGGVASNSTHGVSQGESIFLQKADVQNADSEIKKILNQEISKPSTNDAVIVMFDKLSKK